jgi:hydroxyacylglutathione hydrolase
VKTVSKGPAGSNCYICSTGRNAFVIDPGCDVRHIEQYIRENRFNILYIFLTHSHFDHIAGLNELKAAYPLAEIYIHEAEADALTDPFMNCSVLFGDGRSFIEADKFYKDGERIDFCGDAVTVLHTPGHTAGSVCLISGGNIFTGDTLFQGGIGRSDLPGGNTAALISSLKRLTGLDSSLKVFPGHGPSSTIKREKESNPFLSGV